MQKLLYTVLFSLLLSSFISAQEVVLLEGRVVDSLDQVLELCNVIAMDTSGTKIISFAVTDEKGQFRLKLNEGEYYKIKASHLGFKSYESNIKLPLQSPLIIKMFPKNQKLDDVEVLYEMPIQIKGDTIIYNAESFNKGDERKLEDVLKNLPGFEIDEYGEVKVQGKKVDKVLVEGKPFFDGDSKMATENIPANAVDKIELLRNFTEIGPMRGLDNNDRMALNIKLEEDKKNMVFGDLEAAAGLQERSLLHGNLFYYNPKTNVNLILDRNNIGRQAFGPRDYFRFGAGMEMLDAGSGQRSVELSEMSSFGFLPNNTARKMNNSLAAVNAYYAPKKMSLSGTVIASSSRNTLFRENSRNYLRLKGDNQENLLSDENRENSSLLSKLGFAWEPNKDIYFSYEVLSKVSDINRDIAQLSEFQGESNPLLSNENKQPYSISQKLDAFYSVGKKDLISIQAEMKNNLQNPQLVLASENGLFAGIISDSSDQTEQIFQELITREDKINTQFNYYRILNRTSHLNLMAGYSYIEQQLESSIHLNDDNQAKIFNDNKLDFSNPYFGFNIKKRIGKFIFNPGINVHYFNIRDTQKSVEKSDQLNYLPFFYSKYEISSSQDIQFRYSMDNNFYNVRNLAEEIIVNSYNSISIGNRNLDNAIYHSFSLNYFNFNMFSAFNLSGGLNYQYRINDLSDSIAISGIQRIGTPVNMDQVNENIMAYSHFEKKFNSFRFGLNVELANSSFANFIESNLNVNRSFTQIYGLDFESRFFKIITLTLGYEKAINQYKAFNINSTFTEDRPFARLYVKIHKNLVFRSTYRYNNYRNTDGSTQSEYQFLSAELSYQKAKKPWTFSIRGNNLTDTRAIRQDSFSDNLVNTSAYFVLPRIMLFSVQYDI